jgi:hypothetical protein
MNYRHGCRHQRTRTDRPYWFVWAVAMIGCLAGLGAAGLATTTPCQAASIPAWLDDAISEWNEKNWYWTAATS